MLNQRRFVVGAVLIAAAVGWLVYAGIRSTAEYELGLDTFFPQREAYAGQDVRVRGWVRPGSVQKDARTNVMAFDLARQDGTSAVPVAYTGVPPDMFSEGREVIVEGRWVAGTFSAKQIMTQCPSKYEAKSEAAAPPS